MTHTLRRFSALTLAAACLAALFTHPVEARVARGRETLDALLVRYDREPNGPAKDQLAAQVDAAAHQKYATVSRLFWHTALEAARTDARESHRPILELRLLGRLDEDLSCANSRLFRVTLYANQEISAFLREHFVLYWSSERPVPRVTIDYGDGRRIERTLTGNSAHYVLDEDGHVLDVLPGLYAPSVFRHELERGLELWTSVRGASDDQRMQRVVAYQRELAIEAGQKWDGLAGMPWLAGVRQLLTQPRIDNALVAAQIRTGSKNRIETYDLRRIDEEVAPDEVPDDQVAMWATAGQLLYGIGGLTYPTPRRPHTLGEPDSRMVAPPPARPVLDDASRDLVVRLFNDVPADLQATPAQTEAMIARLEQTLVADTAINQLRLRPEIASEIVRRAGRTDFDSLNAWIYAQVFRTPKEDAWLGLLPRDTFTALPGDGVITRK